jgi:hypothetical protein
MNGLLLVVASMAGLFGGMLLYLAFMQLVSLDTKEIGELRQEVTNKFGDRRGFWADLDRYYFWRARAKSRQLQFGEHWRARPAARRFAWVGLGLIAIAILCAHYAIWP